MPKLKDNQVPAYRLHKQSGQAVVTLCGRDILLGKHGSPESREEYRRRTAEWLVNGKSLAGGADLTIHELILEFWKYCQTYYRNTLDTPGGVGDVIEPECQRRSDGEFFVSNARGRGGYFAASSGTVTDAMIKAYIEQQDTPPNDGFTVADKGCNTTGAPCQLT